ATGSGRRARAAVGRAPREEPGHAHSSTPLHAGKHKRLSACSGDPVKPLGPRARGSRALSGQADGAVRTGRRAPSSPENHGNPRTATATTVMPGSAGKRKWTSGETGTKARR